MQRRRRGPSGPGTTERPARCRSWRAGWGTLPGSGRGAPPERRVGVGDQRLERRSGPGAPRAARATAQLVRAARRRCGSTSREIASSSVRRAHRRRRGSGRGTRRAAGWCGRDRRRGRRAGSPWPRCGTRPPPGRRAPRAGVRRRAQLREPSSTWTAMLPSVTPPWRMGTTSCGRGVRLGPVGAPVAAETITRVRRV